MIEFNGMTKKDIRDSFIEFSEHPCKFKDCMHLNENVCGVKDAVKSGEIMESRYNNYKKML